MKQLCALACHRCFREALRNLLDSGHSVTLAGNRAWIDGEEEWIRVFDPARAQGILWDGFADVDCLPFDHIGAERAAQIHEEVRFRVSIKESET